MKIHIDTKDGPLFKVVDFPCEVGLKRKLVKDVETYIRYFNVLNKFSKNGVHNSVYAFDSINERNKPVHSSARVDKIISDIDLKDFEFDHVRCYLNMMAWHLFLEKHDLQHGVVLSGNGYHVYVGVDDSFVKDDDKDSYIEDVINKLSKMTGTVVCDSFKTSATTRMHRSIGSLYKKFHHDRGESDVDERDVITERSVINEKLFHDLMTRHECERRFCTSIPHDVLHEGPISIYKYATTQDFTFHVMGKKKILLNTLVVDKKVARMRFLEEESTGIEITNLNGSSMKNVHELLEKYGIFRDEIPPCIRILMKQPNAGYRTRFLLVTYLCKMELSKKEIQNVLRLVLSKKKFRHAYIDEERHPDYIHDEIHAGKDYDVTCGGMRRNGYCVDTCTRSRVY